MTLALQPQTRAWLLQNAGRLDGLHIVLTGATGSLGSHICGALLFLGARLTLPVRNPEKAALLRSRLLEAFPGAHIALRHVDLERFASVDALIKDLVAEGEPIDALIHNAGVFTKAGRLTEDGCEIHWQINAASPLRLTRGLLPLLRKSRSPRVVTVTSLAARYARPDLADPQGRLLRSSTRAYGRSKLMMAREMNALAKEEPGIAFAFSHPGVSATGLFTAGAHPAAYSAAFLRLALPVMRRVFMEPEKASLPTVLALCRASGKAVLAEPRGLFHVWGYPRLRDLWPRMRLP